MELTFEETCLAISRYQEPGKGAGVRYPASLRNAAARHVQNRLGQGETITSLSQQLRVASGTLQHWLEQLSPTVVPVTVEDLGVGGDLFSAGGIRIVTPGGYRIEGLSVSQVGSVLRQLDAWK